MRFSILIIGLSLGCMLAASGATASSGNPADEEALKQLSREWMTAIERKDKETLESILADDYVLQMPGDSEHQYVRRATWLENAINMDWSNFRYENMRVNVDGDRAVLSARLFFKISPNPLTFDSGVVDTWERRAGKWQVTNRYLGESALKERISFVLGALAAALAIAAVHLWMRMRRKVRGNAA